MSSSPGGNVVATALLALLFWSCDLQNAGTASTDASVNDIEVPDQVGDVMPPGDGGPDVVADVQPEAGGPTSPGEVPLGLQAWYRSDTVDVADGGSQVTAWPDKAPSGDLNRIATTIPANAPTMATDAGYPFPVLHFPQNTYLQTKVWSGGPFVQPLSFFIVGDGRAYFTDSLNQAAQVAVLGLKTADDLRMFAGASLTDGGTTQGKRAIVAVFEGASSSLHNSSNLPTVGGNAGSTNLTGLTIGAYAGLIGGFALDGYLAEVAVWNRRLTPQEITSLNAYAAARYGVTIKP